MLPEQRIDELIRAGWDVLDSDFDETAFLTWRKRAVDCLTDLLGPHHVYTEYFRDYVTRAESANLLTGSGVLIAVKESGPRTRGDA